MGRPRTNDEATKRRLLTAATEVLATQAPGSMTVRAVANAAGASATAVYTLFGSKEQLVEEVRERAVATLYDSQVDVPTTTDPLADLTALAEAYRRWARAQPHLYAVLFGGVLRFDPSGPVGTRDPVGPLVNAVERAVDGGLLHGPPAQIAVSVWTALHGTTSLELCGAFTAATADPAFAATLSALLRGWSTT